GEEIARKLEAGTAYVNEVAYTAALPETPWGGPKNTGSGRKHSILGLLEFVRPLHIHRPRWSFFPYFKAVWWFPYTQHQYQTFQSLLEMYRRSWFRKLKTLPNFLWNLTTLIKREKRL